MFLSDLIYHIPFWSAPAEHSGDDALIALTTTVSETASGSDRNLHLPSSEYERPVPSQVAL
ncbi:MAG: hypothetical protein AUJ04_05715 [Acidobacteria bacterium 13_1_40CM_3_55_6]|nr:MAG: hypothetical protein AUJ04_05715 [Acidobacteria bacterium 13_1_40CM_3_55_6]